MMEEFLKFKNELSRYKFLQECILTSINFSNQLTDVELSFNYIYDKDGKLRSDLDRNQIVTIKLGLVQVFKIEGNLNYHQLSNPEMINWGLNEISIIKVLDNSTLLKEHISLSAKLFHLEVLWETNRRIDIIFNSMKIYESPLTSASVSP